MDSEIMELIDREIAHLPKARSRDVRCLEMLYVFGKHKLESQFPGDEEGQYIGKALAEKYRV